MASSERIKNAMTRCADSALSVRGADTTIAFPPGQLAEVQYSVKERIRVLRTRIMFLEERLSNGAAVDPTSLELNRQWLDMAVAAEKTIIEAVK